MARAWNSKELPVEELAVRSLLMRLYHSREAGEAFYPAQLVNGEAPALEAQGWIERHGDGWRLTETGVLGWADMNPLIFDSKRDYNTRFNRSLRDEVDKIMGEVRLCNVEGCQNARMVSKSGKSMQLCEDHQREVWRVDAARKRERKNGANTVTMGEVSLQSMQAITDDILETVGRLSSPEVAGAINFLGNQEPLPMDEQSYGHVYTPDFQQLGESSANNARDLHSEAHDCNNCEAKGVIEALRAKSPKLAALIDAMEQEQRAAAELGL
jgi:hypothetical protein